MSNKSSILAKLRSQLEPNSSLSERKAIVKDRLSAKTRGVIPAFPHSKTNLIERFTKHAKGADATVSLVTQENVGTEISQFLRKHNLPMQIIVGSDPRLEMIKNACEKIVDFETGPSDGSHLVSLSHAECGIAETGTLGMLSGAENPTSNNFLPENHLVVVRASDLVPNYEDLWERIRSIYGNKQMPRTVNLITGPSRSGDIEQKLILGAHGPVRLHIMILQDEI